MERTIYVNKYICNESIMELINYWGSKNSENELMCLM